MIVVVVVDIIVTGGCVMEVGWVGSVDGIIEREVVPVFCDPSEGSSAWSTLIGVIGLRVGPMPRPSGTGFIVYHLFASSTAMYTQRRSSST